MTTLEVYFLLNNCITFLYLIITYNHIPSLTIYSSSRSVFKYAIELIALYAEWV